MYNSNVTLEEMLSSKEERAETQKNLIKKYSCPIISFTVIIPGPEKLNRLSRRIFERGMSAIENGINDFEIKHISTLIKKTGPEGYYAINATASEIKERMIEVEESHEWGRLFDIDVIGLDFTPVSRRDLNREERKCLICDDNAALCIKTKKHSTEEVLSKLEEICGAQ